MSRGKNSIAYNSNPLGCIDREDLLVPTWDRPWRQSSRAAAGVVGLLWLLWKRRDRANQMSSCGWPWCDDEDGMRPPHHIDNGAGQTGSTWWQHWRVIRRDSWCCCCWWWWWWWFKNKRCMYVCICIMYIWNVWWNQQNACFSLDLVSLYLWKPSFFFNVWHVEARKHPIVPRHRNSRRCIREPRTEHRIPVSGVYIHW